MFLFLVYQHNYWKSLLYAFLSQIWIHALFIIYRYQVYKSIVYICISVHMWLATKMLQHFLWLKGCSTVRSKVQYILQNGVNFYRFSSISKLKIRISNCVNCMIILYSYNFLWIYEMWLGQRKHNDKIDTSGVFAVLQKSSAGIWFFIFLPQYFMTIFKQVLHFVHFCMHPGIKYLSLILIDNSVLLPVMLMHLQDCLS